MKKLIVLAFAAMMVFLVWGVGAIVMGPYNLTVDLPGFNAISSVGPIEGSDGVDHVSYMAGIAEGNNKTPSNDAHRLIIDVTKFSLPIDIDDKTLLTEAYDATVKGVYPGVTWDVKDQVMVDGHLAAHSQNLKNNIHFICYFENSNLKVTLGARNLTSEEFTNVLRTFHFQNV